MTTKWAILFLKLVYKGSIIPSFHILFSGIYNLQFLTWISTLTCAQDYLLKISETPINPYKGHPARKPLYLQTDDNIFKTVCQTFKFNWINCHRRSDVISLVNMAAAFSVGNFCLILTYSINSCLYPKYSVDEFNI
jgi:hypothetical protein